MASLPCRGSARYGPTSLRRGPSAGRCVLPVPRHFKSAAPVTAVDARTGEFVVFDSAGEARLVDAVGASRAVPAIWPPVTIGNRRFVDGGVRSVANADLTARYERVVIVAPVAPGSSGHGQAQAPAEAAAVRTAWQAGNEPPAS